MYDISFRIEKYRPQFSIVLSKWIKSILRYTNEIYDDDALYWYNERATLSTLAGAIWKAGAYAFEEFSSDKVSHRLGRKKKSKGRTDLWALIGRTEYVIEVKQEWISLSTYSKKSLEIINRSLQAAREDAVKSKYQEKGSRALGISFVIPRIPKTQHASKRKLVSDFINKIKAVDYDFMAYAFPNNNKLVDSSYRMYPGVVLFARSPRRDSTK